MSIVWPEVSPSHGAIRRPFDGKAVGRIRSATGVTMPPLPKLRQVLDTRSLTKVSRRHCSTSKVLIEVHDLQFCSVSYRLASSICC